MLIPDGYGQVNIKFTGVGAPLGAQCTFGVQFVGTPVSLTDLAQDISDAWDARIMPQLSSAISHTSTLLKKGPNDTGAFVEVPGGGAGAGAATGVTPQVCHLISKITNHGGRSGRGRMYLPGLLEGNVDAAGIINPTTVANVSAAFALLLSDLETTLTSPMVLLHGETSPATGPYIVENMICQSKVATQTDRLR
jgi:hypothetical protein